MKRIGAVLIAMAFVALGCADDGDVTEPVAASSPVAENEVTIDGPNGESSVSGSTGKESEAGGETSGYLEGEGVIGVQDCIGTLCAQEVENCKGDPTCAEAYLCVLECDADAECVDACIELDVESLAGPLGDLATCIAENKCLTLDAGDGEGSSDGDESEDESEEEGSEESEESTDDEEGAEFSFPGDGGEGEADEITDVITCVFGNCGDEVNECFTDPDCSKVVECLTTCGADTGCLQECGVSLDFSLLQGATGAVLTCAFNAGCIDLGGFGGGDGGGFGGGDGGGFGGGGDDDEEEGEGDNFGCGDGVCEWWEEFFCEEDCGGGDDGEPDEETCGNGACEPGEEFFCPEDCEEDPKENCGDGVCTPGEVGECDEDCSEADTSGPPSCGDGICEAWETGFCPDDCESEKTEEPGDEAAFEELGVGLECIVDNCDTGMCLNFPDCSAALECMGKCSDSACGEECLELGPGGGPGAMVLQNALECASSSCW